MQTLFLRGAQVLPSDADGYAYAYHDPDDILDYVLDFAPLTNGRRGARSDWLAVGETLSTVAVVAVTGVTLGTGAAPPGNGSPAPAISGKTVVLWVRGLAELEPYYAIRVRVTTSAGRQTDRTLRLYPRHR